jgi:hypothetical protein
MATKSKQSLAQKRNTGVYDFKCNGSLHLNRGLPESTVYDLSTVRQMPSSSQIFRVALRAAFHERILALDRSHSESEELADGLLA